MGGHDPALIAHRRLVKKAPQRGGPAAAETTPAAGGGGGGVLPGIVAPTTTTTTTTPPPATSSTTTTTTTTTTPPPETTTTPPPTTTTEATTTTTSRQRSSSTTRDAATDTPTTAPTSAVVVATSASSAASGSIVVVTATGSLSSVLTLSRASSSASATSSAAASSSSGPGAGTVVGIVAGALIAVVVASAIVGYLMRTKCGGRSRGDDDDDVIPSPFDRDQFKRSSVILDDRDYDMQYARSQHSGHHSPQMSEYSMQGLDRSMSSAGGEGLHRQGTIATLPGLQRNGTMLSPRPPSTIGSHFAHQQHYVQPSFQPGQILPSRNGYPMLAPVQPTLERGASVSSRYGAGPPVHPYAQPVYQLPYPQQAQHLERQNSVGSNYSNTSDQIQRKGSYRENPSSGVNSGRLSLVNEQEEEYLSEAAPRSGTPTNSNVQQTFFSHGRDGSAGSISHPYGAPAGDEANGARSRNLLQAVEEDKRGEERARRTLSVRNGSPSDGDDDAYAGFQ